MIVLLNESSRSATQPEPEDACIILKDHQRTLLQRCLELEHSETPMGGNHSLTTSIGIMGDKVGAGKSYVILSLIMNKTQFVSTQSEYKAFADNHVFVITRSVQPYVRTSVIVIPHNLCKQWEMYIEQYNPNMQCMIVNKNNRVHQTNWNNYDLAIVTCTMYKNFAKRHEKTTFARVFYDEADSINLPGCQKLSARFYWFITASYGNLLNPYGAYSKIKFNNGLHKIVEHCRGLRNNGFIRELFYTVYQKPTITDFLIAKNDDAFVDRSMALLPLQIEIVECKTPYTISILSNIVDREVIRCLNANNVKRAVQCIHPSQRANEENIIELCIDSFKKTLKNVTLQIDFTHAMEYDEESERQDELHKLQTTKSDIENKMIAIRQRVKEANRCIICYDDIVQRTVVNCCSNSFCFKCLSVWLANKPSCPMCKAPTTIKDMYIIESSSEGSEESGGSEDSEGSEDSDNNATKTTKTTKRKKKRTIPVRPDSPSNIIHKNNHKVTNLINILKTNVEKKNLVFSQHDETFETIVIALKEHDISYSFLKGNCVNVTQTMASFKNGDIRVLLINPEHYGSGMNLECTTDVIMFHKLESEMEKQVIGRANRYGRTSELNVWYLLHANEIPA